MRKEKTLIGLLRGLVKLLVDESAHNPEFGAKLERLLSNLPEKEKLPKKSTAKNEPIEPLPDIHAEWSNRGETDFRLWMREQSVQTLRAIIRVQDLDPSRRTTKWKDVEKLADFIADGLKARLSKGFAFIGKEAKK